MADARVVVRLRSTWIVRESDGRTLLLVEAWCGDEQRPIFMQVVDPSDDEE